MEGRRPNCDATTRPSIVMPLLRLKPLKFRGTANDDAVWEGEVLVFELEGHPTAHLDYALIRRLSGLASLGAGQYQLGTCSPVSSRRRERPTTSRRPRTVRVDACPDCTVVFPPRLSEIFPGDTSLLDSARIDVR